VCLTCYTMKCLALYLIAFSITGERFMCPAQLPFMEHTMDEEEEEDEEEKREEIRGEVGEKM
jgi:hypothetical protein